MPKQKPYSFRPDAPLQERVQKILDATGLTAQDLLDRCVRRALDAVVNDALSERRKAEAEYLREYNPPKRKAG